MAAHRSELHKISFSQDLLIDAFIAFEMKFILRIILVLGVSPSIAGSLSEAERNDFFHQRQEE